MDPKLLALLAIAGLIAGTLLPLTPVMGADGRGVEAKAPRAEEPAGALGIGRQEGAWGRMPPVRIRCDRSFLWFGEPCQPVAKI